MKPLILSFFLAACCAHSTADSTPDKYEVTISNRIFQGKAIVNKLSASNGFKISLLNNRGEITDQTLLRYPVYQLDTADVNRDGETDILVGVIKATEFDPVIKKRLFILRIDQGHLRPLWLGSRVCQELVNFKTSDRGLVRTFERTKDGNYAVGLYRWQGFGLTLIRYIQNEIPHNDAFEIFNR